MGHLPPHPRARDLSGRLFTVPTLTFKTLYVLFFITHGRRLLVHLAVTARPTAAWVWRQLVEATPWGHRPASLVRDRNRVYGGDFLARAKGLGIETLLTPVRAPRASAIAERVVRSLRTECLDHVLILNERHPRAVLREYETYYNAERPHRSLAPGTTIAHCTHACGNGPDPRSLGAQRSAPRLRARRVMRTGFSCFTVGLAHIEM